MRLPNVIFKYTRIKVRWSNLEIERKGSFSITTKPAANRFFLDENAYKVPKKKLSISSDREDTELAMVEKEKVCVTGGGGYLASWLIKLLLSKGYKVQVTVRDPENEKNAFLKRLENASENLQLFKADLLDYDSLYTAINGCTGVFHVASAVQSDMVPNPEAEIVQPAITGTMNVLKASSFANVKRVVVVSSIAAVIGNPNWPKGQPMDESCWTDLQSSKTSETGYKWYVLAKTTAEIQALEYGKKFGLEVVTVCPSYIIGPMLQSTIHGTNLIVYRLLKDGLETVENKMSMLVDVRDVADALLLVYEKPDAEGRYICTSHRIEVKDLVEKLKGMYPNYSYPKKITEVDEDWNLSSEKLQKLGWRYRLLEETLVDSVKDYREKGVLESDDGVKQTCSANE